ncbi:hypothetical protein NDU88_006630 [Pleurodeles waltl]|uniref:C2H2-type domain-containing protein n=3 Tax=Pleurodeles waltl TaxID=8319 RepID=A0AAV7ULJ8_PLEWA|nr:hypothetical protein NDU88_006630 [Pleurodeles waltl]
MQCEWGNCKYITSHMDDFCRHAWEHLQQHLANNEDMEAHDEFSCLWQDCGFCCMENSADLIRHVYFHCYHTKLKQWGQAALESQPNLGHCLLDFQSRNIVPDIPENFVCLWQNCQKLFENIEEYYRHVEAHSSLAEPGAMGKENHLFCLWKDCASSFKNRNKLREHLRSHTQEKVMSCPTCGGMFANRTKFFDHVRRQIADEELHFQCAHCSKRFATERLLRDHMRNHVNYYKCPLCDMTCPLPSALQTHMRFRHSDERPHKCQFCEYSCKNLIDLRRHLDTHSKGPTYYCEFENCDFSARSLASIKVHHRKVHEGDLEPKYMCHICDKCFSRGYNLTLHLRKKHQFKWPPGHPRFRYKEHEDGFLRLQLVRYESMELTEQLLEGREQQSSVPGSSSEPLLITSCYSNLEEIHCDPAEATPTNMVQLNGGLRGPSNATDTSQGSWQSRDDEHLIQTVKCKRVSRPPFVLEEPSMGGTAKDVVIVSNQFQKTVNGLHGNLPSKSRSCVASPHRCPSPGDLALYHADIPVAKRKRKHSQSRP